MDQRSNEEAAIREAALVCVSALRCMSGAHQALALQIIQSELAMIEYLDTEDRNRKCSAAVID